MQSSYRASQAKNIGTRRRLRMLMVVVLCFMGWAAATYWDKMEQVIAKTSELELLEQKLIDNQSQNEEYKSEIERLNDPEYLGQIIRQNLHMKKEGETLFIQTE